MIGLDPGQAVQQQAYKPHQAHVQEGGGKAADGEIVGGDAAGTAEDPPKTGKGLVSVRQAHRGDQKAQGDEGEKQL